MVISKKAQVGGFITTFVATIIIVIMILIFLFFSTLIRLDAEAAVGEAAFREDSLGLDDGVGYMEKYSKLVEVRGLYHSGIDFEDAMAEVGYYG